MQTQISPGMGQMAMDKHIILENNIIFTLSLIKQCKMQLLRSGTNLNTTPKYDSLCFAYLLIDMISPDNLPLVALYMFNDIKPA